MAARRLVIRPDKQLDRLPRPLPVPDPARSWAYWQQRRYPGFWGCVVEVGDALAPVADGNNRARCIERSYLARLGRIIERLGIQGDLWRQPGSLSDLRWSIWCAANSLGKRERVTNALDRCSTEHEFWETLRRLGVIRRAEWHERHTWLRSFPDIQRALQRCNQNLMRFRLGRQRGRWALCRATVAAARAYGITEAVLAALDRLPDHADEAHVWRALARHGIDGCVSEATRAQEQRFYKWTWRDSDRVRRLLGDLTSV